MKINKRTKIAWTSGLSVFGIAGMALALSGSFGLREIIEIVGNRFVPTSAPQAVSAPMRVATAAIPAPSAVANVASTVLHDTMTTRNASGWLRTVSSSGAIDTSNPFFQELGSNGRTCNSCHQQAAGWSLTPTEIRERFAATDGTDPLFRRNDGSNSPFADVSTLTARRTAYSMLLNRGVIRVGIGIPANAEFELLAVDDPYHFASATELSLFRRPLPATNLTFNTDIMWDGRERIIPFLPPMHAGQANAALLGALFNQAANATIGHAEGLHPTPQQADDIVAFEIGLTTAQIRDDVAGFLNADDALGGPRALANQRFHVGINDTFGADPTGAPFDPGAMNLFAAWTTIPADDSADDSQDREGREIVRRGGLMGLFMESFNRFNPDDNRFNDRQGRFNDRDEVSAANEQSRERAAISRGERLFNERPMVIADVAGLNDALGVARILGTCTTCHNAPNVGNQSITLPLNLGLTDASRRTPDMPLYTLRNKSTNQTLQTTDPGVALITGKWTDIGKFKGPTLRALAARPPYFHNGFAASLEEVVNFYDTRFQMNLSEQAKRDMVAFLRAL